jgi:lipopolysaccharide heptosyltransferase I
MSPPMKSILVVRLGHLGDVIHGLPAVAALRDAFPAARIGWVIEERWSDLLLAEGFQTASAGSAGKPLIDRAHPVKLKAWRRAPFSPRTWRESRRAARELRNAHYEAVLDLQGLWKSALVVRYCGAPIRVGFERPKETGAHWLYTLRVTPQRAHVVDQNRELVEEFTGQPAAAVRFPLPRDAAAEAWCDEELARRGLTAFAILSPGAGWGAKRWPAESYAAVARALAREAGLPSLVNIGPGQRELGRAVASTSGDAATVIDCTVGRLVALTRRASLFVGGDTGPVHLAAALDVPVVAVFGPTSPERNGPYSGRAIVLRSPASRTSYAHVDRPDAGLRSISVEEVSAAALRLLRQGRPSTQRR